MEPLPDAPDPFVGLLRAVAADRVRDAATARSRTHWLVRQAEEDGTLVGVLADLAERGEPVVCVTGTGRRHVGVLEALGADFVALRGAAGGTVLVALGALAQVRTQPGATAVSGDRPVRVERRLAEVLADLVGERPDVVVGTGAAEVRGALRSVGRDVGTVRVDGRPGALAYVAVGAIDEVRIG
jgi:hypothetical protein